MNALRLHRQFMTGICRVGIHPGQAICLHVLAANDGIAQRDLAAEMHIAAPTLSRMLRTMERAASWNGARTRPTSDHARPTVGRGTGPRREARGALGRLHPRRDLALPPEDRVELARLLDNLSASIARAPPRRAGRGRSRWGPGRSRP